MLNKSRVTVIRQRNKMLFQRKKLIQKLKTIHNANTLDIELLISNVSKLVSSKASTFISHQLRMGNRHPKGRRYSVQMRHQALVLHSNGAKAYKHLAQIFCLPSKTSLSKWLMTMKCLRGFHDKAFTALAERMKYMSKRDKVCCIMIDEVSLKRNLQYDRYNDLIVGYEDVGTNESRYNKPATSALVFMLRGLSTNWNQPIGYVFMSSACKATHVQNLIQNCLNKCEQFGIDVKVIFSDQGPNFQQLANKLAITTVKPYFTFNNKNYFYMFDPPHLLKSIRNNLFKYDFHFGKCKIAKWKFIDDFFKIDQQQ